LDAMNYSNLIWALRCLSLREKKLQNELRKRVNKSIINDNCYS
jgi:hypothetical protein